MAPKRKGKYGLPVPLQEGLILKDTEKREWRLGPQIAQGGFGLIYLASPRLETPVDDSAEHVIKLEYLENGPLFSELKFYQRAAKQEHIKKWMKLKHLPFLGVPLFWGSGQAEYNGKSYRFMVMERLGENLQTAFERNGRQFSKETVLQTGVRMLDVLEYIHENEYVHGDVKAANLLFGYRNAHEVYLADYGLAYRYCPNGSHKEYQENPRKRHNGTIEFTSLDAHKGVALSRRGDLETLGYCMLQWTCGRLPWERCLRDPDAVQAAKTKFVDELPDSATRWTPAGTDCGEIATFLKSVSSLEYKEKPKYETLKRTLLGCVGRKDAYNNGMLDFTNADSILAGNHRKADLPKPAEEKGSGLENKEVAYRRKAAARMKKSQAREKQMLPGLNKPLQTQVGNTELPPRTGFYKILQTTEDECTENGAPRTPSGRPGQFQMLTSFECRSSEASRHEELYRYATAITVLFILILLALHFL